jgi:hypothetical protein
VVPLRHASRAWSSIPVAPAPRSRHAGEP